MVFHDSFLLPPPNLEYLFNLLRQDFEALLLSLTSSSRGS